MGHRGWRSEVVNNKEGLWSTKYCKGLVRGSLTEAASREVATANAVLFYTPFFLPCRLRLARGSRRLHWVDSLRTVRRRCGVSSSSVT